MHEDEVVPDDEEIEAMLSSFSPQPTTRFFDKMAAAPWLQPSHPQVSRLFNRMRVGKNLAWGLVGIVLIIVLFGFTFIPSVRVAASQLIHLFLPASSNQLAVQVTLTSPGDMLDFSNPVNFPLRIPDAHQLSGFEVKQISSLPEEMVFIGARYDSSYKAVTLFYKTTDYGLFLTQRKLGNGSDLFSIGASANVTKVKIGSLDGEFVTGGWKAVSTQYPSITPGPINISAVWDNGLTQSTLRWQANGIAYELRTNGKYAPSQLEFINWANGLK